MADMPPTSDRSPAISGGMWPFVRSVAIGTLVAAGPVLPFTVMFSLMTLPDGMLSGNWLLSRVYLAALPLIVSTPIVFVASIVFGLPLTFILHRCRRESSPAYVGAGAVIGAAIPAATMIFTGADAYWMSSLGLAGGAATGASWWRSRRRRSLTAA